MELSTIDRRDLTINYRSPIEINELVAELLEEIAPGVPHSKSIRRTDFPPEFVSVGSMSAELETVVARVRAESSGQVAVVSAHPSTAAEDYGIRRLTPATVKGLEFDTVIVVEPTDILALPGGGAHLYVALTRPTRRLVVVHERPLPAPLDASRGRQNH